ncbi:MAG TPA: endonuclease [Armatimonadota bacterium]
MSAATPNRYNVIVERIFMERYREGMREVVFEREDIERTARELGIVLPKNFGDVIYSFRFRVPMPAKIQATTAEGEGWVIKLAGQGKYRFELLKIDQISVNPNLQLSETKIPDATPGIVAQYALSDEQALLAKLRYNRLVDIFTGVTCYSLQNHLRTTVRGLGQVETDELYLGIDKKGVQYILPVQAKGGRDKMGIVQIEQDIALCEHKFPMLVCRPIGAQFIGDDSIALFEFERMNGSITIASEKHYRLVPPASITLDDLRSYQRRLASE